MSLSSAGRDRPSGGTAIRSPCSAPIATRRRHRRPRAPAGRARRSSSGWSRPASCCPMRRRERPAAACSRSALPGDAIARLPPPHHLRRRPRRRDRRSVSLRPRPDRLRSAPVRRRHAPSRVREARRASHQRRLDRRRALRGVGARTPIASASIGDFNGWDGRVHPMRLLVPAGVWEIFIPDLPDGEKYKFEIRTPAGRAPEEERSVRRRVRGAAADGVGRPRHLRLRVARRRRGWRRGRQQGALARPADVDLRGAPRLVGARAGGGQPLSHLSRAGAPARAVREGAGLHAHRAAAGDGASVLGIVGLSGARLLRADQPVRPARRLQVLRRRVSSGRARRHPRLGARALSRRTSTASRGSTARRSTSTPIRGRASTRTGAR